MKRSPLRRVTKLRRRRGLNAMSKKRRAIAPKRRELVVRLLATRRCEFPTSVIVCAGESMQEPVLCGALGAHVHEILTRARGGDILDESNCMVVCARHHEWIHANPVTAATLGVLAHSWES